MMTENGYSVDYVRLVRIAPQLAMASGIAGRENSPEKIALPACPERPVSGRW
jgi:hypothetical protein